MNAFDAAEKNGRAADLQKELEELFNSQNKSPSKDATSIPATFRRVTVVPVEAKGRKLDLVQLSWDGVSEARILRGRKMQLCATLQDNKNKAVPKTG